MQTLQAEQSSLQVYASKSFWSTFGRVHEGIFCVMIQKKCLASFPKSNYLNMSENLALKSQDISMKFEEKKGEKNL